MIKVGEAKFGLTKIDIYWDGKAPWEVYEYYGKIVGKKVIGTAVTKVGVANVARKKWGDKYHEVAEKD